MNVRLSLSASVVDLLLSSHFIFSHCWAVYCSLERNGLSFLHTIFVICWGVAKHIKIAFHLEHLSLCRKLKSRFYSYESLHDVFSMHRNYYYNSPFSVRIFFVPVPAHLPTFSTSLPATFNLFNYTLRVNHDVVVSFPLPWSPRTFFCFSQIPLTFLFEPAQNTQIGIQIDFSSNLFCSLRLTNLQLGLVQNVRT